MLGLNIENSRIYRDLQAEADVKIVKAFAKKGFSIEEIMENVDSLTIEEVQRILQQTESSDS